MSIYSLIISRVAAAGLAAAATSVDAQSLESRVEAYLEPYLATANFQGTVLIAQRDQVLYTKSFGLADRERGLPNTPNTGFHLASVSRGITAIGALLLVQDGKLSVDDPLSTHVPDWPRGDDITIHHLLTLSAGFPNTNEMMGYFLWQRFQQTPTSLVEKFRDDPLQFEPGSRTVHSNSNYNMLALVIERASGKPFGQFLEERIFAPVGMHSTTHDGDASRTESTWALGYSPVGFGELEPVDDIDWSVKSGNGSLVSTTLDLYRLDRAIAHQTLLEESAIQALFTEYFPHNGYGWFVSERFGSRELFINGSSPGFGAFWGRSVDSDVTVIVLGNIYNTVPGTIGPNLIALTLGESVAPPAMLNTRPEADLAEALVGTYQFGPDFYRPNGAVTISMHDGQLFSDGWWLMPTSHGDMTFQHRRYWSVLTFRRGADGAVTELQFDDYVGRRSGSTWARVKSLF